MNEEIDELIDCLTLLKTHQAGILNSMVDTLANCVKVGGKILFCGNGGSAAECQHMAAEYTGTLQHTNFRQGIPAIALTTDTSLITAWTNDFDFDSIFSRQLETLGNEKDVLIAYTTSGNSRNILHALRSASSLGIKTICFTGLDGGGAKLIANQTFHAPSDNTARIQEVHTFVGHLLCKNVEQKLGFEF